MLFVDTNVFIYARQAREPAKQRLAEAWIDHAWREQTGRTSVQVLSEYYANVTQRLMAYALQRKGNSGRVYDYEMPAVRQIVHAASASGYRWSSLIAGIAVSAPFQAKEMVP